MYNQQFFQFFAAVNRSTVTFEASFSELGFLQHENLRRARLRLNIPLQKHCNLTGLNTRVMDQKTGQIFGDYVMFPRHSGVNFLILTKSLRKLAAKLKPDTKLTVRITLQNPTTDKNLCSNVVSGLSSEAYLVTNTDEFKTRKRRSTEGISTTFRRNAEGVSKIFRRDTEGIPRMARNADVVSKMFRRAASRACSVCSPSMSRSVSEGMLNIFRRSKRNTPTCIMEDVTVNLTNSNSSASIFILPKLFKTGVCGQGQPVPSSNDPMIQALAQAITTARQTLPASSNSACCLPSKFQKLTVLYFDSMQHVVLRHVDNAKVTSCACSNAT